MSQFSETSVINKIHELNLPPDTCIAVGETALEAAVGTEVWQSDGIDLIVDDTAFNYLRDRWNTEESHALTAMRELSTNDFRIRTHIEQDNLENLQNRSFTRDGIHVASLPDVYGHLQRTESARSQASLENLQKRLYSPRTLPSIMLEQERQFLYEHIPEQLRETPEVEIAANGLYIVRTMFGDTREIGAHAYFGEAEPHAMATQHCWEHSALGIEQSQANITAIERQHRLQWLTVHGDLTHYVPTFTDADRLTALAGYANHDVILGHGRRLVNPLRHDELQSADHLVAQLEYAGVTEEGILAAAHAFIMATTFNERTRSQDVDPTRGHVHLQELSAGTDLSIFRTQFAVNNAICLAVENLTRVGAGYDQPLNKLLATLQGAHAEQASNSAIRTAEDGLRLIDQYPSFPTGQYIDGTLQQTTLKQAFVSFLRGSAAFFESYTPPGEWLVGNEYDVQVNQRQILALADAVESGAISAVASLYLTPGYRAKIAA